MRTRNEKRRIKKKQKFLAVSYLRDDRLGDHATINLEHMLRPHAGGPRTGFEHKTKTTDSASRGKNGNTIK